MSLALLLAQLEPFGPGGGTSARGWGQQLSDVGLVAAAGFGVGLILLIWARFLRRPRRSSHSQGSSSRSRRGRGDSASAPPVEEEDEGEGGGRRRRRRRSPRREHRPRNPTLADTGGLPPARAGEDPQG